MRSRHLDVLRGIAVLAVIAYHIYESDFDKLVWWDPLARLTWLGNSGVGLFFILSAWVLTAKYSATMWTRGAKTAFWWKRGWRILPLFWMVLLIIWIWQACDISSLPHLATPWVWTWHDAITHILGVWDWTWQQNGWVGVEWSLGVELSLYAAWPWLMPWLVKVWGGNNRWRWRLMAVAVLAQYIIFLVLLILTGRHDISYAYFSPVTQIAYIALGVWTALWVARTPSPNPTRRHKWVLAILLGGWLLPCPQILQVLVMPLFWWMLIWASRPWWSLWTHPRWVWLAWWGQRSYSAYFLHWIWLMAVWSLLRHLPAPPWVIDTVCGVVVISGTRATMKITVPWIEERLTRWGLRLVGY